MNPHVAEVDAIGMFHLEAYGRREALPHAATHGFANEVLGTRKRGLPCVAIRFLAHGLAVQPWQFVVLLVTTLVAFSSQQNARRREVTKCNGFTLHGGMFAVVVVFARVALALQRHFGSREYRE